MAISDTINSLKKHIGNAYTAIGNKKGTVPTNKNCENLQAAIESISTEKEEQDKTVTITENGTQKALPDDNKVLTEVTIVTNVPATPTQEVTKDLDMAAGDQIIIPASGYNLSKATVKKPATLVAENIKTGVSIGGVTGTLEVKKEEEAKEVDLAMASGNQTITPTSGKVLSGVIVKKPVTMLPENIKENVNIGGVVGTFAGGGAKLNIAYGDTAPEDTSKLWIKSEKPSNISFPIEWTPEQIAEEGGLIDIGVLEYPSSGIAAAAVADKIYLFGVSTAYTSSHRVCVFDTTNNTLQNLRYRNITSTAAAAVADKIYLFGGYDFNGYVDKIEVFDTTDNTIQTLSIKLPIAAETIAAAAVGTKIYLFGGNSKSGFLNTIQVFDTTNNTIQTLSTKLPIAAISIGRAVVGTKIYLFGGNDGSYFLNTIQVFDTTNNTIQTLSTTLSRAMSGIAAAAVADKIYLFGGYNHDKNIQTYLDTIQVFDTINNTIQSSSAKLLKAADSIAAAAVADKIYLFGGYGFSGKINKIYQFTDEVPLSSDNIVVTQKDYSLTFTLLKPPTEVKLGCKNVYKGDRSLAKFIDAYVYDGVNWVNVNTNDVTFTKLYAPTISILGKTLTITNDGRNGSKVTNYKVYNGSTLLTTVTATMLDLTTVITANGTYNISVIATGTGYTDSDSSNVVKYNYASYNITTNLTNVTANASNPTTVSILASSTLTFTASTGYNLPDNVNVTGAEFTWTKSSGTLVLSNPTGAVSVTVAGVAISRTITATLTNVTAASGNATTIATGETKVLTYTAASGYTLPDSVTVIGATGVWNKDAGTLTLSNPTANVTFTIAGVEATSSGYQLIVTEINLGGSAAIKYKDGTSANVRAGTYQNVVSINSITYTDDRNTNYALKDVNGINKTIPYTLTSDTTLEINSWECLIEGTQITLADGTAKAIEDIIYDDELLVWNFYDRKFDKAKPTWIKVAEVAPRYNLVKFSNGSEVGFVGAGGEKGYHRIFNKEAGAFTYTGNFKETPNGTTTFAQDETFPTVVSQEIVEKEVKFYNVITDKHYNLFANGILTSCRLSNKYRIENMKYVGEKLMSDEQEKAYFDRIEDKRK